jgi:hypothetical protein
VKSFIDKESESNVPLTPKTKETENQRLNLLDDHGVSFYYKSPLLFCFFHFLSAFLPSLDNQILVHLDNSSVKSPGV